MRSRCARRPALFSSHFQLIFLLRASRRVLDVLAPTGFGLSSLPIYFFFHASRCERGSFSMCSHQGGLLFIVPNSLFAACSASQSRCVLDVLRQMCSVFSRSPFKLFFCALRAANAARSRCDPIRDGYFSTFSMHFLLRASRRNRGAF